MQHFRRITSLQEDMEALGLTRPSKNKYTGFASEKPDPIEEKNDAAAQSKKLSEEIDSIVAELTENNETVELQEGEETSAGDHEKARLARRKKKAFINKARKLRQKKNAYKLHQKRLSSLKKGRSAGPRRRFVLKQAMGESVDLLNSLKELNLEMTGNIYETLEDGFLNVDQLAATLGRKFAVVEEMLPVEHPESEYDYEDGDDNVKSGGKTGDATDSAKDAPSGNVMSKDDHPESPAPRGNVKFEQDDDYDMKDQEDDSGDKKISVDMTDEMFNFRLEAQDALDAMKTHVISPEEAGNILRDMVQYLGGAMKMYMDLAKNIGQYAYAGVGAPRPNPEMVKDNVSQQGHNYAGQDDLDKVGIKPEGNVMECMELSESIKHSDIKKAESYLKELIGIGQKLKKELFGKGKAEAGNFLNSISEASNSLGVIKKDVM